MTTALGFLSSILSPEDPHEQRDRMLKALDSGIDRDFFYKEDRIRAWMFMQEYFTAHGVVPSIDIIEIETGINFPPFAVTDSQIRTRSTWRIRGA